MNKIKKIIDFAFKNGFINLEEKQKLIQQQNTIYAKLEKLKAENFEYGRGYVFHYDRDDVYCECMICQKKSHNFYEVYEPSPCLDTDVTRYFFSNKFRDIYFICDDCMKNDKSLRDRFL